MKKHVKQVVYEKLKKKLKETGHCCEGFIKLDSLFVREKRQIRIDCKDSRHFNKLNKEAHLALD